jgi:hypothetical protein
LSIVKPPYGVLSAIDLKRGELMFQVPHGDTPDVVRNHAKLKGLTIPKTGRAAAWPRRHEDARHPRRSAGHDDARARTRRDASRVRQDNRERGRRGADAGAAEWIADDLTWWTADSTSSSR